MAGRPPHKLVLKAHYHVYWVSMRHYKKRVFLPGLRKPIWVYAYGSGCLYEIKCR